MINTRAAPGKEVQFTTYQAQRITPASPTTISESTQIPTSINYNENSRIAAVTGIPDGSVRSWTNTISASSLGQQLVDYAHDYMQFFSTASQSLSTPAATRYAVQYEGTLSYNYNALIMASFASRDYQTDVDGKKLQFTNIVNYIVKFMCVLTSVLRGTISMEELLMYSVKISDSDDIYDLF